MYRVERSQNYLRNPANIGLKCIYLFTVIVLMA
jgi:hypothetical protein